MKSIDEEKETTDTTSQAPQRGRGRRKRKQEPNEDQEILSDDSQSIKRKRYRDTAFFLFPFLYKCTHIRFKVSALT